MVAVVKAFNDEAQLGQKGTMLDRSDGGVKIEMPPVYSLRNLPKGYWIWTGVLLACPGILVVQIRNDGEGWEDILPGFVQFALALVIIWAFALSRLRQRSEYSVRNGRLMIRRFHGRRKGRRVSWPTSSVEEIRFSPISGKMIVRIRGEDSRELFVSSDPKMVELVAKSLSAALHDGSGVAPADTSEEDNAEIRGAQRRKRIALGIAGVLSALAFLAMIIFPPLAGAWFYLFLPAAIPAGIALGEQPHKFWI
jgi:hypothetical protein